MNNKTLLQRIREVRLEMQKIMAEIKEGKQRQQQASTIHIDLNFEFTTKEELIQKAFDLYGGKLSSDDILDRCSMIWEKHLRTISLNQDVS